MNDLIQVVAKKHNIWFQFYELEEVLHILALQARNSNQYEYIMNHGYCI